MKVYIATKFENHPQAEELRTMLEHAAGCSGCGHHEYRLLRGVEAKEQIEEFRAARRAT